MNSTKCKAFNPETKIQCNFFQWKKSSSQSPSLSPPSSSEFEPVVVPSANPTTAVPKQAAKPICLIPNCPQKRVRVDCRRRLCKTHCIAAGGCISRTHFVSEETVCQEPLARINPTLLGLSTALLSSVPDLPSLHGSLPSLASVPMAVPLNGSSSLVTGGPSSSIAHTPMGTASLAANPDILPPTALPPPTNTPPSSSLSFTTPLPASTAYISTPVAGPSQGPTSTTSTSTPTTGLSQGPPTPGLNIQQVLDPRPNPRYVSQMPAIFTEQWEREQQLHEKQRQANASRINHKQRSRQNIIVYAWLSVSYHPDLCAMH
jgi:hypothetical protein